MLLILPSAQAGFYHFCYLYVILNTLTTTKLSIWRRRQSTGQEVSNLSNNGYILNIVSIWAGLGEINFCTAGKQRCNNFVPTSLQHHDVVRRYDVVSMSTVYDLRLNAKAKSADQTLCQDLWASLICSVNINKEVCVILHFILLTSGNNEITVCR